MRRRKLPYSRNKWEQKIFRAESKITDIIYSQILPFLIYSIVNNAQIHLTVIVYIIPYDDLTKTAYFFEKSVDKTSWLYYYVATRLITHPINYIDIKIFYKEILIMKKTANTKNISKKVISLVAAAVMSVSMLTVGGLTASAASEYQNNNYAVVENTDGKAVRNMTVYVSPEWQQADATFLMYIYNSQNNLYNVVSVDSIEGTKCQFKYAYGPDYMIVLRCKPGTTASNFSWDKVWNKTDNIKIADLLVKDEYTIQGWEKNA